MGLTQKHYYYLVEIVAFVHIVLLVLNIISVPCLIIYTPFYIWAPLITLLASPLLGGSYCVLNRLENFFRLKANMSLINDRTEALINIYIKYKEKK